MVGNEKSKDQEMETDQMSQMGKLRNNGQQLGKSFMKTVVSDISNMFRTIIRINISRLHLKYINGLIKG